MKRISIFLVTIALIVGMVGCGDTTPPSQNLEIRDWYDLDAIRDNLDGNYILMNDLDSTTAGYEELASPTANEGKGWEPIGTWDEPYEPFTGSFDGQGYEIGDLFINRPDEESVGLFGFVYYPADALGVIENIGVVNIVVTGGGDVGGLVGYNEYGTVSDCYSMGAVIGEHSVGGLVGHNFDGTVSDSYFIGSVAVTSGDLVGDLAGGLVGWNYYGTVSDCYSMGSVTGEWYGVGGLAGQNLDGTVSNSYSSANVTGEEGVGGLVGNNDGDVSDCYSTGIVTGDRRVGGLVGDNSGTVNDSYSSGSVTGGDGVGGLVGWIFDGAVSNSYYNYDEVLINSESIITIGALFGEDFEEWLADDKFLDVNERLSQENDYYVINNVSDFKELLAFGQDNSLKFRLKNDLDLAAELNFYIPYLAGEFDGNGHKISNLNLDSDLVSPLGLFGYLASCSTVTGVSIDNANITGTSSVGGLVGYNDGTVSDCYIGGSVTGEWYGAGGLVGYNGGIVNDSHSTGSVTGNVSVGGLVGGNDATVSNSYSTSSVTGGYGVGGLVGGGSGMVDKSYAVGNVTGGDLVGGLVGFNGFGGTVSDSYSIGSVSGDDSVGGLVGGNDAPVSNCYSNGSVTGGYNAGGLVGYNTPTGTVSNSFWDTETSGQATSDGGIGKNTTEMQDITTFSGATWDITAVTNPSTRNPSYIWNIATTPPTYPFLSWQP